MAHASISKEIEFDAGHRVPNHESKCQNPHGHRYRVVAHVSGDLVETEGDSQEGMVLDFGFLKQLLTVKVHDVFDHGFIVFAMDDPMLVALGELNDAEPKTLVDHTLGEENRFGWKVIVFPAVPTAENLALWIWNQLRHEVGTMTNGRAWLTHVEVWETPTSCATYGN
jgi:6-pyruvoyltetrahydropterin/6-carboxytetrahydropterin synthase